MNNMEDKVRYSDAELEEFRTLVLAKLERHRPNMIRCVHW